MGFNPTKGNLRAVEKPFGHTHTHPLAILGNTGGMYSESLDMHTASPLHQCLSLEDLDRYLCGRCTDVRGHPGVSVSCVAVGSSAFA